MNLSCSGGGLPESGCLFFKVVAGVTNVLEGQKWNKYFIFIVLQVFSSNS